MIDGRKRFVLSYEEYGKFLTKVRLEYVCSNLTYKTGENLSKLNENCAIKKIGYVLTKPVYVSYPGYATINADELIDYINKLKHIKYKRCPECGRIYSIENWAIDRCCKSYLENIK